MASTQHTLQSLEDAAGTAVLTAVSPLRGPQSRRRVRGATSGLLEPWPGAVHWLPAGLEASVLKKTLPQMGPLGSLAREAKDKGL